MKRFWSSAELAPHEAGFTLLLDGKPLTLPGGGPLTVPFRPLASAIAVEWANAGGESRNFTPDDLPLTRLATTAQDRIAQHREDIIEQLVAYGMNDLLCYRAADESLAAQEYEIWQPWLDWAQARFGAKLLISNSIIPVDQPAETRTVFRTLLGGMSIYQLAGLGVIVPALGSLVLGLAVEAGTLPGEPAAEIAHLGETWQESRWGADNEAAARRARIAADIAISARFMLLCHS